MTDLDPGSGRATEANGINEAGQIVGDWLIGSRGDGLLWSGGTVIDLPSLPGCIKGYAFDINESAEVVGRSRTSSGTEFACRWVNAGVIDLNSTIPSDSGWQLQRAMGINDSGQIAGYGLLDGNPRAFLLTPTPESSTLALLAVGAIGLATYVRRRRKRTA